MNEKNRFIKIESKGLGWQITDTMAKPKKAIVGYIMRESDANFILSFMNAYERVPESLRMNPQIFVAGALKLQDDYNKLQKKLDKCEAKLYGEL